MARGINSNVTRVFAKGINKKVKENMAAKQLIAAIDDGKTYKVKSANITDVQYDDELKDLTITFNRGKRKYVYYDVSKSIYTRLLTASSKGVFFHKFIRFRFKYAEIKGGKK